MNDTDPLLVPVYAAYGYKPFGEFTLADVEARANELRAATGFGPTAKVGSIARAWGELGRAMAAAGAPTVAHLGRDAAADFARRTWTVPPRGSLL
ncbi:MAG TPA: hypothetical protein VGL78_13415 [Solirubrobacteraceae bacterium]